MSSTNGSEGDHRLLIVSNRLPITIRRSEGGKYEFSMSSGGLVTGLSGLSKTTTFQWYGWPGLEVPEDELGSVKKKLKDEFNATPVFMDDKLADRHYNGFSSKWPPPTTYHSPRLAVCERQHQQSIADWSIQTRSYGPSFITTPARSFSTKALGMPTVRPTFYSPKQL